MQRPGPGVPGRRWRSGARGFVGSGRVPRQYAGRPLHGLQDVGVVAEAQGRRLRERDEIAAGRAHRAAVAVLGQGCGRRRIGRCLQAWPGQRIGRAGPRILMRGGAVPGSVAAQI